MNAVKKKAIIAGVVVGLSALGAVAAVVFWKRRGARKAASKVRLQCREGGASEPHHPLLTSACALSHVHCAMHAAAHPRPRTEHVESIRTSANALSSMQHLTLSCIWW